MNVIFDELSFVYNKTFYYLRIYTKQYYVSVFFTRFIWPVVGNPLISDTQNPVKFQDFDLRMPMNTKWNEQQILRANNNKMILLLRKMKIYFYCLVTSLPTYA